MTTLSLETLNLTSSIRTAPLNGAPSSSDYNEGQREVLNDLTTLTDFLNTTMVPYLNALSVAASLPTTQPVGLEGRTILADSSDESDTFYNATSGQPLVLADSLRLLRAMISSMSQSLQDIGIQIAQVQSQVSPAGQSNLSNAIRQVQSALSSINTTVSEHTTQLQALTVASGTPINQVNADWTATSGAAQILHLPNLAALTPPPSAEVVLLPGVAGNFQVAHGWGTTPRVVIIQMSSDGTIWFQPTLRYDDTYLYLTSSGDSVTGYAEILS